MENKEMLKLTAKNVEEVFLDCLFEEGVTPEHFIAVEGIVNNFGFDPIKIDTNKDKIKELLDQLPETFQEKSGGGWSFLNACITIENVQWGEHRNMEQLVTLGIACNQVKYCMPRSLWSALPGGVPYFMILAADESL
jgi:hypothetical protein